jgi:uncharacterized membrane protein
MHELVAVTFPDASITHRATEALQKLQAEGSIKIYRAFVVAKGPSGKLFTREVIKRGHGATTAGALIGGLAGLPFGPLAITIGAAGGALIGYSAELLHEGDAADLVQTTSRDLAHGSAVAVVEISAQSLKGFTTLMEQIGGTVLCK